MKRKNIINQTTAALVAGITLVQVTLLAQPQAKGKPARAETHGISNSAKNSRPEKSEARERPERPEKSEARERPERPGKSEARERPERPGKSERPEHRVDLSAFGDMVIQIDPIDPIF